MQQLEDEGPVLPEGVQLRVMLVAVFGILALAFAYGKPLMLAVRGLVAVAGWGQ
jgi:hypothetical protein